MSAKHRLGWSVLVLSLLSLLFLVPRDAGRAEETKATATEQDLKNLQGEWKFEWMEMEGERRPPDESQAASPLKIRDMEMQHGEIRLTFKIDAGTDPKVIDVVLKSDDGASPSFEGIYQLKDDMLTICLNTEDGGKQRPTQFKSKPESKLIVVQLSRVKK
jgi:uncharacterized protein (TIGR03067 family)